MHLKYDSTALFNIASFEGHNGLKRNRQVTFLFHVKLSIYTTVKN